MTANSASNRSSADIEIETLDSDAHQIDHSVGRELYMTPWITPEASLISDFISMCHSLEWSEV